MNSSQTIVGVGGVAVGLALALLVVPMFGEQPTPMPGRQGNIDKHFIEQMIPHHEGAVAMAQLALEKSSRPEVRSLAEGIIEAQTREITDMTAWYEEWFGGAPSATGHGMMHGRGMEGDLQALSAAADFDTEFLNQMIVHHEVAVMMAQMLAALTERSEMKTLADQIITSQNREILLMQSWLEA